MIQDLLDDVYRKHDKRLDKDKDLYKNWQQIYSTYVEKEMNMMSRDARHQELLLKQEENGCNVVGFIASFVNKIEKNIWVKSEEYFNSFKWLQSQLRKYHINRNPNNAIVMNDTEILCYVEFKAKQFHTA